MRIVWALCARKHRSMACSIITVPYPLRSCAASAIQMSIAQVPGETSPQYADGSAAALSTMTTPIGVEVALRSVIHTSCQDASTSRGQSHAWSVPRCGRTCGAFDITSSSPTSSLEARRNVSSLTIQTCH